MTGENISCDIVSTRLQSILHFEKYIFYYKRFRQFDSEGKNCLKNTLKLFRLDLETLEELEVEGYSMEDDLKQEHNIIFNTPYCDAYMVYWVNKKEGKKVQKKYFETKELAKRLGQLHQNDEYTTYIIVHANSYELIEKNEQDYEDLKLVF